MSRTLSFLVAAFGVVTLAASAETARTTLKIEGMTCGGCVPAVNLQLKRTDGVLAYEVSFEKGEAQVSFDPAKTTPARIAESVTRTGYTASVKVSDGARPAVGGPASAPTKDVNRLSEQEGLVFTERMAKRVESRTKLSLASSTALRADLRRFCIEWLVGQGGRDTKVLLGLAATYMDAAQLEVYEEALKEGFQALPGESLS